ncbi:MAG: segregation/condensation protein A [bacterium]|nr:segregation/condensation protein A [bacterium]
MPYVVKLEQFEGPLDLLLHLIEREELSITEISLARVTDDFLVTIREGGTIVPEELADFLVVAAKLILIKSRILLPGLEVEEEDGLSLEIQLKLYREFVEASRLVAKRLSEKKVLYPRPRPFIERIAKFSPPPSLTIDDLAATFRKVVKDLEPLLRLPKAAIERAVSIHEKMQTIQNLIREQASVQFADILKRSESKTEIIVNFLAILELAKQQLIELEQQALFHDIVIHQQKAIV